MSNEDCKQAKVLVSVQWYQQKYGTIELNDTLKLSDNSSTSSSSDNTSISNTYPIAPEILEIDEHEKFKDSNGRTLNITIRGERNHKNCYFRLKDISRSFEMPNLCKVIQNEKTSYELNVHYKIFVIVYGNNVSIEQNTEEVYLTYKGLLKVLFASRSGNAESFQDWVTETLFTVQLGTEESKYELVKSMFGGASIHAIKEAFKTSSGKTPCVYLFVIGKANELLKTDKYSKDTLLYKFGKTDDLPRRSGEHERDFKRMFKIDHIELMLFSVIDPKYITDAENSLKKFFENNIINYENKEELIVLNNVTYKSTTQHYKLIKNSYIGCYMEMQNKIDELERRLKNLQNEYDLSKEKLGNELIVKDKDFEIIKQHIQLLEEKHQYELSIKEKDKTIEFNEVIMKLKETEHQNEILLMKTQLLELQLKQYIQSSN